MKTTKVVGIVLSILLSTLLLVGTGTAWGLTKLIVNSNALMSEGMPEDAIADLQDQIDTGELPDWKVENKRNRIETNQYVMDKMAEAGYTFECQNWGWAEQLVQKQTVAYLAGTGPDVILGETQMPGYAVKGYLEPFPDELAEKVREIAVPGAYLPMTVKGKIYGIAPYPGVNILFWNKEHFRAAGLDPEVGPKTWSEWLEMANQVTEAGQGKFYGGGVFVGPNFGGSLRIGPFMMMTPGGGFVDEDNNINFTHPANIRALKFIRELDKNTPPGIAGAPGEGGFSNAFNQGRICFDVDGPWRMAESTQAGIDVGCSPLPIPAVNGRPANVTIGAVFYGVPTYSKNKEGAFKYIMSFLDEYVQERSLLRIKRSCVLKSWGEDPANQDSYYYTIWQALQSQVAGLPTFNKENAKVWDIFHQLMTKAVVLTSGSVEEIMAEAQRKAEALQ